VPAESILVTAVDTVSVEIDWSALLNYASLVDPYLTHAVIVITDSATGPFNSAMTPIVEARPDKFPVNPDISYSGVFVSRTVNLKAQSLLISNSDFNFRVPHFVSFAVKTGGLAQGPFYSSTEFVDTVQYSPSLPWLENLTVEQVSDSFVRVMFTAHDYEEEEVRIIAIYSVDGTIGDTLKYQAVRGIGFTNLYDDFVKINTVCSAYVKLDAEFKKTVKDSSGNDVKVSDRYFSNNDTATLAFEFWVDDSNKSPRDSLFSWPALTIDLKPPGHPHLSWTVDFNRDNQTANILVNDNLAGDLDTIFYGPSDSLRRQNSVPFTGAGVPIQTTGMSTIYFTFIDSFGNALDTLWSDFVGKSLNLDSVLSVSPDIPLKFNNDDVRLIIYKNALSHTDSTMKLNFGIFTVDKTQFTSQGFIKVRDSGYVFVNEGNISDNSAYYSDGISIMVRCEEQDSTLALYRYFHDAGGVARVEYIGGQFDSSNAPSAYFIRIDSLGRDSMAFYDYLNLAQESAAAATDSMYIFLAVDTQQVVIDEAKTSLSVQGDTISFRLVVTDNTVNLNSKIKVFGFEGDDNTNARLPIIFKSLSLYDLDGDGRANTTVDSVFKFATVGYYDPDYSDYNVPEQKTGATLSRGVYAAVWVSDMDKARRKQLFISKEMVTDSISGTYSNMYNWNLISFPGARDNNNPVHVMEALKPAFNGQYDKDRVRIYRLRNNVKSDNDKAPWQEFSADFSSGGVEIDADFIFHHGSAYLAITRPGGGDNDVSFSANQVWSPSYTGTRGFLLGMGTPENSGWRLFSLPFRGTIKLSAIEAVSRNTSTVSDLTERMWKFDSGNKDWKRFDPSATNDRFLSKLGSEQENECFLVYLFPGDELVIPVTDDTAFIDPAVSLSRAFKKPVWRLPIALKDVKGGVIDQWNVVGVTNGCKRSFMDPPSFRTASLGIIQGRYRISESYLKNDGKGKRWLFKVFQAEDGLKDYQIDFGIKDAGIPESLLVYLNDYKRNCSVNLRRHGETYPLVMESSGSQKYEVLVGDNAFINAHALKTLPTDFSLSQNYPNPFNPVTTILYSIPNFKTSGPLSQTRVWVDVFDIRGRQVTRLTEGSAEPGYRGVRFIGLAKGKSVASGIYIYRIEVRDASGQKVFVKSRKMIMVK
jgi:hypothetical protein